MGVCWDKSIYIATKKSKLWPAGRNYGDWCRSIVWAQECNAHSGQKRTSYPLELELQVVGIHPMLVLRTQALLLAIAPRFVLNGGQDFHYLYSPKESQSLKSFCSNNEIRKQWDVSRRITLPYNPSKRLKLSCLNLQLLYTKIGNFGIYFGNTFCAIIRISHQIV